MSMKRLLKQLLNIKTTVIEKVEFTGGDDSWDLQMVLTVRPTKGQLHRCPKCEKRCDYYDEGQHIRRWRALDLGVMRVYLKGRAPRIRCREHGVIVARVPWAHHASRFTHDFEDWVAWLALNTTRSVVSEICRIDYKTVGPIIARVRKRLERSRPSRFDGLVNIGIDETSYKKGHKYLTVVVNHDTGTVIWAHKGYGKAVLSIFFEMLTAEQRASIRVVTADGAGWITDCVEKYCPDAYRLLDGFHIVQWATDALDNVRKRVCSELKVTEVAVKYGRGRPRKDEIRPVPVSKVLKGSRYSLVKNPENLTQNQRLKLEMLAKENPQIYLSYVLKEKLRLLLKMTVDAAEIELDEWLHQASNCPIPEMVELSQKICRHKERILDTIALGYSNARVEALNNKIKVTIRMGYGFRNIDNLISLIMLRCSKLPLQLPGRRPVPVLS